jgi:DNA-binding LytR/AlgR family response regulator
VKKQARLRYRRAGAKLEAIEVMAATRPDLLLLDIDMPELDGLALAARYAFVPPVAFVTAHDEHAVRAFELGAIDYLLKPVRVERLAQALERAAARVPTGAGRAAWPTLPPSPTEIPRVVTHERGTTCLFDARAITRFRSADKYTIFVAGGAEHLTEEPLGALRSGDGGSVAELSDGQVVRISRRMVTPLKRALAGGLAGRRPSGSR